MDHMHSMTGNLTVRALEIGIIDGFLFMPRVFEVMGK